MSLIPAESSSFADLLGRGLDGSKKSKWRDPFTDQPKPADSPESAQPEPSQAKKHQPEPLPAKTSKTRPKKAEAEKLAKIVLEPTPLPEPVVHEDAEPVLPPVTAALMETSPPAPAPVLPAFPPELLAIPEPAVPAQFVPPPPEPAPTKPIIKAPLVIQPEDEPPRRPIPIVRIARSKQNPHGNGRETTTETNGHGPADNGPSSPLHLTDDLPPAAPRLRPKPSMRPRYEDEPQAPSPGLQPASEPVDDSPKGWSNSVQPWIEPNPVEEDLASPEEPAWIPEDKPRRRFQLQWGNRLTRCLAYEGVAILVLIAAVLVGLAHRSHDDPLNLITRILAIAAAVVAAIIPVLFYGLPERFPRDSR